MNYYEAGITIRFQSANREDADALLAKLVESLSKKLGPTELQVLWKLRPDEWKDKK